MPVQLDGSTGYVAFPAAQYFGGSLTIMCWVTPIKTPTAAAPRIVSFGNGRASDNVGLTMYGSNYYGDKGPDGLIYRGASKAAEIHAPGALTQGQASFVAFSFDAVTGTGVVSVNGQQVASGSGQAPNAVSRAQCYLGKSDFGDALPNAVFEKLSLWSVAKTLAEVQAAQTTQLTGTETGLVAYWPFDETTGTSAADKGTSAYTATLNGGATWVAEALAPKTSGLRAAASAELAAGTNHDAVTATADLGLQSADLDGAEATGALEFVVAPLIVHPRRRRAHVRQANLYVPGGGLARVVHRRV